VRARNDFSTSCDAIPYEGSEDDFKTLFQNHFKGKRHLKPSEN
jgi:hypothetical protein